MSGVADCACRFICRKKNHPAIAKTHDVTHLGTPQVRKSDIIQPVLESLHGDDSLRLKSGRTLDYVLRRRPHIKGEEQELKLCGKLIFTALA